VSAANEGAISLHPIFISHLGIPNVVMVPLSDKEARWDLFVIWQRGKTAGSLRALLDALQLKPAGAKSVSEKAIPAMREPLRSE
jgi:hypothetical protein